MARQGYYFYFLYALRSPNRRSTLSALRSTLTYGCRPGVPIGPAWVIPMTQAKSLEDLPSQLDMDWQDSVSLTPTPSLAATRNLNQELEAVVSSQVVNPPEVVAVDTFAEVSQIAAEVVMDAAQ